MRNNIKVKEVQHPRLLPTASSYKTALVPMSVTETTQFAMMADTRAARDRDWQDMRAILQWKMRMRQFLVPFIERSMQGASEPMSLRLASILGIVQGSYLKTKIFYKTILLIKPIINLSTTYC